MLLNEFFTKTEALLEGGNIFKGELATDRINLSDIGPTVKWLERYTGLPLQDNMLGTTGRKSSSGDLDLGVDVGSISKDELVARLSKVADAMKVNPTLRVQLHAGYYDLATPFFQGVYEMKHLPIPAALQSNIEYRFYDSGHMVYAKESSLKELHDSVADFIRRTSGSR